MFPVLFVNKGWKYVCIVDIKVLLSILNRPWMIEPNQADYWGGIAAQVLSGQIASVPTNNANKYYNDTFFRVDEKGNVDSQGSVRVISLNGPIGKYSFCGTPGTQAIQQAIRAANAESSIKSIVLWVDSPGGQVDGTDNLAKEVKASEKPIVSFVDGMMCSAAYWIGSSSREIIVDRANNGFNAVIGSIGTMASWMDQTGAFEKQGVKIHRVYASKSGDKNGQMQKANNGDYTDVIAELDDLNETFLSAVTNNREGKLQLDKENVLSGKTYNAKEAIKYGLADRMGDFQTAVSRSLQLAKQQSLFQSNNNQMAFERTLTAAKATEFSVVEGGFLVDESHLNNVEAALAALDASAIEFQGQITALQTEQTTLTTDLATANSTIATLNTENAKLKRAPAAAIPGTVKAGADKLPEPEAVVPSWKDPNNPSNKAADALFGIV